MLINLTWQWLLVCYNEVFSAILSNSVHTLVRLSFISYVQQSYLVFTCGGLFSDTKLTKNRIQQIIVGHFPRDLSEMVERVANVLSQKVMRYTHL